MEDKRPSIPHCYSVVAKCNQRTPKESWSWEIRRTPELGVRLYGTNFNSAKAAKLAGEKELHTLLKNLSDEKHSL